MSNIGDCLNAPLHQWITGKPWDKRFKYMGVGTTLRDLDGHSVWGTGYDGFRSLANRRPGTIHAVRGPLTRDACLNAGWDCPEIYGDPAILLPRFLFFHFREIGIDRIGYVPHFKDPVQEVDGWHTISPRTDDPAKFVGELVDCKVVMSQSLHGLILADAYEVPNVWVPLSGDRKMTRTKTRKGPRTRDEAWMFKYEDYFASLGVERTPSTNPDDARLTPIPEGMADKLLEACPW